MIARGYMITQCLAATRHHKASCETMGLCKGISNCHNMQCNNLAAMCQHTAGTEGHESMQHLQCDWEPKTVSCNLKAFQELSQELVWLFLLPMASITTTPSSSNRARPEHTIACYQQHAIGERQPVMHSPELCMFSMITSPWYDH